MTDPTPTPEVTPDTPITKSELDAIANEVRTTDSPAEASEILSKLAGYVPRLVIEASELLSQLAAAREENERLKALNDGYASAFDEQHTEIERLKGIVGKLPLTADGVPIVPGMEVWCAFGRDTVRGTAFACPDNRVHVKYDTMIDLTDGGKVMVDRSDPWTGCVYSTRAAALAAAEKSDPHTAGTPVEE